MSLSPTGYPPRSGMVFGSKSFPHRPTAPSRQRRASQNAGKLTPFGRTRTAVGCFAIINRVFTEFAYRFCSRWIP